MKRETYRHPKTLDLAARLGVSRPEALGYLALLWDFVADAAPQGDIGKWPNGAIARACDWMNDPDVFVNAVIAAGWIDADAEFRLVVHDWPDHCERWLHLKLARLGLKFIPVYRSTAPPTERSVEGSTEPTLPRDRTEPNRTEPNPTIASADGFLDSVRRTANRIVGSLGPPKTKPDETLALKVAVLVEQRALAAATLEQAIESVRVRTPKPARPYGYLHKSLKNAVQNFNGLLKETTIPTEIQNGNGHHT